MEKCSLLLVSLNRNGFFTSLYYHYIFNLLNSCLSFFPHLSFNETVVWVLEAKNAAQNSAVSRKR